MKIDQKFYKYETQISYGRRILSFLFISLAAFVLLYSLVLPYTQAYDPESYSPIAGVLVAIFPLIAGTVIGTKKGILIDRINKTLTFTKTVGIITYHKKSKKYQSLEYVSVFRNYTTYFEAKLFYDEKQAILLFETKKEEVAVRSAQKVSNALSIPLNNMIFVDLDALEPLSISMEERQIDFVISEGERYLWQTLIAAASFTMAVFLIYYLGTIFFRNSSVQMKGVMSVINLIILCLGVGISFSVVRDYEFDFKNNLYRMKYRVGPISYGKWKIMRQIDYVSIHKNRSGAYPVNLWLNSGRHVKLGVYGDENDAVSAAKELALKFEVYILHSSHAKGKTQISYQTLLEEKKKFDLIINF